MSRTCSAIRSSTRKSSPRSGRRWKGYWPRATRSPRPRRRLGGSARQPPSFATGHQDSTYWGLDRPDIVTAWVAFTPAHQENGAMQVIPSSHKLDQVPHRDTFAKDNLLTRGQEVAVEVDESKAVRLD